MATGKELKTGGFIMRGGRRVRREELARGEQDRRGLAWNRAAMKAAGYSPVPETGRPASG